MEPASDTASAPPMTETSSLGGGGGESSVQIVKGKRTKRQRPQSPIPFRVPSSSPAKSDEGSSDICSNIQHPITLAAVTTNTNNNNDNNNHDNNNDNNNDNSLIMVIHDSAMITNHDDQQQQHHHHQQQQQQQQPTWSSSEEYNLYRDSTTTTEQEEDMANCLILLAQGQSRFTSFDHQKSSVVPPVSQHQPIGQKYTSRRFMETGTSSGSAGYYVYECRTCGKTFPSFQALGGHRASHKKPKTAAAAAREEEFVARQRHQVSNFFISDDEVSPRDTISANLSLQLNSNTNRSTFFNGGNHHHNNSNNNNNNNNKNKPRVHECAICGAEFSSGQALGGHMRRHRGSMGVPGTPSHHTSTTAAAAAPTALSLIPLSAIDPMDRNDDHYFLRRDVHDQNNNDDQKSSMMLMATMVDAAPSSSLSPETAAKGNVLSLDLDLNLPAPAEQESLDHQHQQHDRRNDIHQCSNNSSRESKFHFASKQLPQDTQQQQSQQLVFSPPALVDCHY